MTQQNEANELANKITPQSRQERRIRWLHGLDGPRAKLIAVLCFGGGQ